MTEYLTDVKVLSHDTIDTMNNWDWDNQTGSIANGVFEMRGTSVWASSFTLKGQLVEGDAIMLKFKVQRANAQSELVFLTGEWQTDTFRQFGIYNGRSPRVDLFQGKYGIGGNYLNGNLALSPDNWYYVLIAIGKNGKFLAIMWDPNNEAHRDVYNEATIAENWSGRNWYFMCKENEGETLSMDDFYRISSEKSNNRIAIWNQPGYMPPDPAPPSPTLIRRGFLYYCNRLHCGYLLSFQYKRCIIRTIDR